MEDPIHINPDIITPSQIQSQSQSTPLNRDIVKKHYERQIVLVKQAILLCKDIWEPLEPYGRAEKFLDILQEIILNAKIDRKEDRETIHFYSRELPTQAQVQCTNNDIHAVLHYPSALITVRISIGKNNEIYVDVSDL